ncbi:hypothetical protein HanXRQr2_Chr05g0206401 [Helianthus annuus]|uniref:Uncharacterized protein n=1 Tax=Helianthus annuus TaxID=4232 RepID=A0A9K3NMH6_HELAN|nr:hypothetical protein HanXRQr2_Chr05g0206401 [Helianthus annuus]KAJ0922078.1 hypothetical protein HanPSC8_Chr05g0199311 [Helianthus annuus]
MTMNSDTNPKMVRLDGRSSGKSPCIGLRHSSSFILQVMMLVRFVLCLAHESVRITQEAVESTRSSRVNSVRVWSNFSQLSGQWLGSTVVEFGSGRARIGRVRFHSAQLSHQEPTRSTQLTRSTQSAHPTF